MESDDDMLEMQMLQDQNTTDEYTPLLHLLQRRHLAAFKSLVRRALAKRKIDINHQLSYPVNMSFLDKAASDNLPEFIDFLLQDVGADPNIVNAERNRAPIHFAAEESNVAALQSLLRHPGIQLNLEAGGLTALHYAVKANCEDCARLLLEAGASPNIPNSRGQTALHFAADKDLRAMVQLILDNGKLLILDVYTDRKKETARMIIARMYPDLKLPKESEAPDKSLLLRYYLTANDETNFLNTLNDVKELDNRAELLRMAISRDLRAATKELLCRSGGGAPEPAGLVALGRTALEQAHPEILRELLRMSPKLADRLLLPACQELGLPARLGPNNRNNRLECLRAVLAHPDVDVRQQDDKGNSPLHYAARAECREAVDMLLKRGSYIGHANAFGVPPLAHVAPGILEAHLDSCLGSANERTEEYEIVIDYRNLVPHCDSYCYTMIDEEETSCLQRRKQRLPHSGSESETLLYLAGQKSLRHLLKHPVIASFLYLKYLRIRHVLYLNFALYLLFYALLIVNIWLITNDAPIDDDAPNPRSAGNATAEEFGAKDHWRKHPIFAALLAISLIYLVIRELLQFASSPLRHLSSFDNWLELGLICLTVALLVGGSREVGAVAVLLSTWELVVLIGQHPRMSTNIEMFKTVTRNFTRCLFLYIFLILAFALDFYVLFKAADIKDFPNPLGSLFKTIVMLTGEFEAGELPFLAYPVLSRLIFIGFIFLIVIILLNLLNGLAVNDTAEILAEAELVGLVSRARLVAYVERLAGSAPSSTNSCSCLPRWLTATPGWTVKFLRNRMLLFPLYLPQARLSVKPLKSCEIRLHGRGTATAPAATAATKRSHRKCSSVLRMEPELVRRAKAILAMRGKKSNADETSARLDALDYRLAVIESLLRSLVVAPSAPEY